MVIVQMMHFSYDYQSSREISELRAPESRKFAQFLFISLFGIHLHFLAFATSNEEEVRS